MDDLLPVVVGGLVAVIGGFVGAWIQGRREHKKWLRERRFDAFVAVRSLIDRYEEVAVGARELKALSAAASVDRAAFAERAERGIAQLAEVRKNYLEAQAPLMILGPRAVIDGMRRVIAAIDAADSDAQRRALQDMSVEMRKSLRVFK